MWLHLFLFLLWDLIEGLQTANNKSLIRGIRKDLPILFVSGSLDPVGGYSKGIWKASSLYKAAGIQCVRVKLYDKGRHEILNDTMRDEVMRDVVAFYKEFL
ncbi:MAG: alpha/beta hydrolase [Spirochaetales bacterium]|nr:alpha/beta hydrolase [Candidatus Physcosoma equi]